MSLFDQRAVVDCFKNLTRWFSQFKSRGIKIPPNFDVHILINMTVILFNSYHALGITAAMNFWFTFSDMFPIELNIYFLKIFMKHYFFKIFLHWSLNVREAMAYFICYRILYYFEKKEANEELSRLLLRINKCFNIIAKAGERYSFERFKWENKPKLERRQHNLDEIKLRIIEQVVRLPSSDLSTNFFPESEKFTDLLAKSVADGHRVSLKDVRLDGKGMLLDENNFDYSLLDIKDSKKKLKMVTVRDYRVKLTAKAKKPHQSMFKVKNVTYCQVALETFRKVKTEFYTHLVSEGDILPSVLPVLSLKLPIDEFEFIDSDDMEW
jgi:hypothetical protein